MFRDLLASLGAILASTGIRIGGSRGVLIRGVIVSTAPAKPDANSFVAGGLTYAATGQGSVQTGDVILTATRASGT